MNIPCFVTLYKILLTEKKSSKVLKWNMIKYINNYNVHNCFYSTISKIDVLKEFEVQVC